MFCIHCGEQIDDGDRFCEFCGGLQEIAPKPAAKPQPAPAVQQQMPARPQPAPVIQPQPTVHQANRKKPPIALFVILGSVLSLALIVGIVVIVISVVRKDVKREKDNNPGTENLASLQDQEYNSIYEEDLGEKKESGNDVSPEPEITQPDEGKETEPSWDNVGRPELSDFTWRTNADAVYSDPNVEWLDASKYQGDWKGMIIYSADGSEELVNFTITVTPENVTMLADWYMVHIGGNELLPEDSIDDVTFTGYEFGNGIHVEGGNAVIEINEFWEIDGVQYARGVEKLQGAADSEVYLIRP